MTSKIRWRPNQPCPCKSGKPVAKCCLQPDGKLRKQRPNVAPPGPRTGYAHPGCYLRSTLDCSERLSAEHYISRAVLEAFPGNVETFGGFPWSKAGEGRIVGINSLTAKILCSRHNSSLSDLDAEAGRFFRTLQEIDADLDRRSSLRKSQLHLFNGEALELWMLKVTCGFVFSRIATTTETGVPIADDHVFNMEKVLQALYAQQWDTEAGIYLGAQGRFRSEDTVTVNLGTSAREDRVVGCQIEFRGLPFSFVFDMTGILSFGPQPGWIRRPSPLVFKTSRRNHTVMLTWPTGTVPHPVTLSGMKHRLTEQKPLLVIRIQRRIFVEQSGNKHEIQINVVGEYDTPTEAENALAELNLKEPEMEYRIVINDGTIWPRSWDRPLYVLRGGLREH